MSSTSNNKTHGMKFVKQQSFILLLGISLLPASVFFASPVQGAIEPPYKEIEYCYRIDNSDKFPDFVLIARYPDIPRESFDNRDVQLNGNACFSRNSRDDIVAIRRERFRESDAHTDIIRSGISAPVSPVKTYNLKDSRKKIEDIFTIDALDDQTFSLRLAKKIVHYDDDSVQERVYATAQEGIADPPGPGYEYTDTPIASVENSGDAYPVWYRLAGTEFITVLAFILASSFFIAVLFIHFYIAVALFTLAQKFTIRHRWRAWVPIANIRLLVELAAKPRRWFWIMLSILIAGLIIIPNGFIISTLVGGLLMPDQLPDQEFMALGYYGLAFLFFGALVPIATIISEYVFLAKIFSSLAFRCGRPAWWGPLMVLVPPVGLVLLGVLAWSKYSGLKAGKHDCMKKRDGKILWYVVIIVTLLVIAGYFSLINNVNVIPKGKKTVGSQDVVANKSSTIPSNDNTSEAMILLRAIPEVKIIEDSVTKAGRKPFFTPEGEDDGIVTVSLRESFPDDRHTSRIETFNINVNAKEITVLDILNNKNISIEEWKKIIKERFQ